MYRSNITKPFRYNSYTWVWSDLKLPKSITLIKFIIYIFLAFTHRTLTRLASNLVLLKRRQTHTTFHNLLSSNPNDLCSLIWPHTKFSQVVLHHLLILHLKFRPLSVERKCSEHSVQDSFAYYETKESFHSKHVWENVSDAFKVLWQKWII